MKLTEDQAVLLLDMIELTIETSNNQSIHETLGREPATEQEERELEKAIMDLHKLISDQI